MRLFHVPCLVLLLLLTGGCSEEDELRRENTVQKQQLETLAAQNRQLLETQQSALAQLQDERQRSALLAAEDRTVRTHHLAFATTLTVSGCALAACLYGLWRLRRREPRDVQG